MSDSVLPTSPEPYRLIQSLGSGKAEYLKMRKDYYLAMGKSVTEHKDGKWIITNPDGTIEELS